MKTKFISAILFSLLFTFSVNAEIIVDDFESNAMGWNECAFESNNGTAVIDKGVLTITSKGENKAMGTLLTVLSGVSTKVGRNTFFETHCYAPIDISSDFKITSNVLIDKIGEDRLVGFVFNYRDSGNFYCISFNDERVMFMRYENNEIVGTIEQGVKWQKSKKAQQQWILKYESNELAFSVNGVECIRVRYMPLLYTGVGFYTFGKQKLEVSEMTYEQ